MPTSLPKLILASTSRYRAELLGRLGVAFETAAPKVDECHQPNEPPAKRAQRLAREKSMALAAQFPHGLLIGSDQVAALADAEQVGGSKASSATAKTLTDALPKPLPPVEIFDKPGTESNAIETLMSLRGKSVNFYTAVCLHNPATHALIEHTDVTSVDVREDLTDAAIRRYVQADDPLDCAGAFKVESLGIALFTAVRSEDPTALMGLPLIAVAAALRSFEFEVP